MECLKIPNITNIPNTSKFLSESFILTSTNPQYDERLFIDLPVQNMLCTEIVLNVKTKTKKQFLCKTCSELLVFIY